MVQSPEAPPAAVVFIVGVKKCCRYQDGKEGLMWWFSSVVNIHCRLHRPQIPLKKELL